MGWTHLTSYQCLAYRPNIKGKVISVRKPGLILATWGVVLRRRCVVHAAQTEDLVPDEIIEAVDDDVPFWPGQRVGMHGFPFLVDKGRPYQHIFYHAASIHSLRVSKMFAFL